MMTIPARAISAFPPICEEQSDFPLMPQNMESEGQDGIPTDHSLPRSEIVDALINEWILCGYCPSIDDTAGRKFE